MTHPDPNERARKLLACAIEHYAMGSPSPSNDRARASMVRANRNPAEIYVHEALAAIGAALAQGADRAGVPREPTESMVKPETCQRCGHDNPSWSAPSPLWNTVMRGGCINGAALFGDMVCASCFMALAIEVGVASGFRVTADVINVPLQTVTPSGRVWDAAANLWVNPGQEGAPAAAIRNIGKEGGDGR